MIKILSIAAVIAALLVAYIYFFQRTMIYFPEKVTELRPQDWGASNMQVVNLTTADQLVLHAWYSPPDDDKPLIIFFHGNAGHIGTRAERFQPFIAMGFGVLLVEYRGYGDNPGKPSEDGLYHDARAAIAFANAQGIPDSRMILYGESLGTAVAIQMATEKPFAALVLQAPLTSLLDIGQLHYPFLPVKMLLQEHYDSLSKIPNVSTPLLFMHGDQDDIVPIAYGEKLFAAANAPKKMITLPGIAHNDFPDMSPAVDAFLRQEQVVQ